MKIIIGMAISLIMLVPTDGCTGQPTGVQPNYRGNGCGLFDRYCPGDHPKQKRQKHYKTETGVDRCPRGEHRVIFLGCVKN